MQDWIFVSLSTYGYALLFALIFLESAGLPLPGETALVGASVISSLEVDVFDIRLVISTAVSAAILGDNLGYLIGLRVGPARLNAYAQKLGVPAQLIDRAIDLVLENGGKLVFFGRFTAFLRMLAGPIAGACGYRWLPFLAYNAAGGSIWALAFGMTGYLIGDLAQAHSLRMGWSAFSLAVAAALCWFVYRQAHNLLKNRTAAGSGREMNSKPDINGDN